MKDKIKKREQLHSSTADHKQTERALKESEEKFRVIFEYAPDGYYLSDLKGNFIDGNRAAEKIVGYKREELIGKNFLKLKLLHPRELPKVVEKLAKNAVGRPTGPDEFSLRRKDGKFVTVEISTFPVKLQGQTIVLGIARDITRRKKQEEELNKYRLHLEELVQDRTAELLKVNEQLKLEIAERRKTEEDLRKSEEKYRLITESTSDLIVITTFSLNPVYTFVGPSHKAVMGYEPEDLIGKSGFQFIHPDDIKRLLPLLKKYIGARAKKLLTGKQLKVSETIEYRARDKSGNWHYLESTVNNIGDHLLFVSKDITARKQAEQEKRELEEKLAMLEKMEAVGRLAGGVAHDLNNVLSAIVSYPELLLMDLPQESDLRDPLLTMKQSGDKAVAIVEDLLTLTRGTASQQEVINLNDIVGDYLNSAELQRLKAFNPQMRIKANLDTNLGRIRGTPVHLSKTVMNLMANAAEAMPEGGAVEVSTSNRQVDKPLKGFYGRVKKGHYAVLRVSDSGVGIAQEDLKKIFEPFYTKKVMGRKGTGLGMAVIWGTVHDHKGYIDVKSVKGAGTTFDLYFPLTEEKAAAEQTTLPLEQIKGRGEKILVVDDVPEQREIAAVILSRLNYSVDTVASGEEAIAYMKTHSADLLLLDMIMAPGIDGLDTYREIIKLRPGTRAIIASGFTETDRVKEAQKLGAGEYIKKPYTLGKIGTAIKAELE
jgi:two-component system cell cycle sensor histidine kinase/response regulator CckA